MPHIDLDRRRLLAGLGAAAAPLHALAIDANDPFAEVEAQLGGRLGVYARRSGGDRFLARRADERFAMASSFKWLLAAAVLERVDHRQERLDRPVPYRGGDLLPHSPVTAAHLAGGALPVESLAQAAVEESDNGAANLLLKSIGGPAALTAFLRRHGDTVTRLDRMEPALNSAIPGDPRDTTTPRAMAANLDRLLNGGDLLSPASALRLRAWLVHNRTGDTRIRAGLPQNQRARVGDKTGTGQRGAIADVAFIPISPGTPPLILAVYLQAPAASAEARDAAIARCASIAYARLA